MGDRSPGVGEQRSHPLPAEEDEVGEDVGGLDDGISDPRGVRPGRGEDFRQALLDPDGDAGRGHDARAPGRGVSSVWCSRRAYQTTNPTTSRQRKATKTDQLGSAATAGSG